MFYLLKKLFSFLTKSTSMSIVLIICSLMIIGLFLFSVFYVLFLE